LREKFNSLGIEGLNITDLNSLNELYINLEYTFPNGQRVKLLEDDKMYLGNQVCIYHTLRYEYCIQSVLVISLVI
jgi:hypothetical protein